MYSLLLSHEQGIAPHNQPKQNDDLRQFGQYAHAHSQQLPVFTWPTASEIQNNNHSLFPSPALQHHPQTAIRELVSAADCDLFMMTSVYMVTAFLPLSYINWCVWWYGWITTQGDDWPVQRHSGPVNQWTKSVTIIKVGYYVHRQQAAAVGISVLLTELYKSQGKMIREYCGHRKFCESISIRKRKPRTAPTVGLVFMFPGDITS